MKIVKFRLQQVFEKIEKLEEDKNLEQDTHIVANIKEMLKLEIMREAG